MKKDELLVPRLDFLIPMSWWELWDTAHLDKASALGRIVEINPDWVIEVVNNEHRLEDVLHDFRGIYAEDEHFVPRISTSTDESVHSQMEIDNTTNEIMAQIRDIFDEIDLTHYINNNTDYDIDDLDDRFYTIIHNKLKQINRYSEED